MPHEPGRQGRADRGFEDIRQEEQRRRFPFLYGSQAAPGYYGRDHLGRPFFSERLPWVRRESVGVIRLDAGLAASQGVEIARDPNGYVRVRV